MTDELFSIPPSDSPRLAWMKRHGVHTQQQANGSWYAWHNGAGDGKGDTEDEAIYAMAINAGIRLWNEEGL